MLQDPDADIVSELMLEMYNGTFSPWIVVFIVGEFNFGNQDPRKRLPLPMDMTKLCIRLFPLLKNLLLPDNP